MFVVCVVAAVSSAPNKVFKNFYLAASDREVAEVMTRAISSKGFKAEGERIFPDQIESIVIKEREKE